jgi:anti-sigma regulatory factor (Ser/Thr protein kinase)
MKNIAIPLLIEADVRHASESAADRANEMGFDKIASAEIALAVSEIAQNVIRHAGEGIVTLRTKNDNKFLTIAIVDKGSGIENIERAMKKGYSSLKTSLGIGLDVAKRSVDEFEIRTDAENGTEIILRKFLPISEACIDHGVVSIVDEGYAVNGDEYLIKEYDGDKVLLAVIDGTGEGYPAHVAALLVKEYLSANYRVPLEELLNKCHRILSDHEIGRGATVALARVDSGYLYYLGVGDTHAHLLGEKMTSLHNHEGTMGQFRLPTLRTKKMELADHTYLILCTDGIKSSLWLDEDQSVSAQQLANTVFKNFHKDYGDVTVLVTKYLTGL